MTGGEPPVVLAVDSGGSGLRVVLARGTRRLGEPLSSPEPVRTGARGIDAGELLERLLPLARRLIDDAGCGGPVAAAVGAAGFATLGEQLRAELPSALARELGVRRVALAADAVAAYIGALGPRPGAVVAAGTGLIAIGTDLERWRRADGWGHLLGDCGGGAWIGRAGLEAALRAYDGRGGGSARLLTRAEATFGPMDGLPGRLYPRHDRPAVLASFAPEVGACAVDDPVAAEILREAARHMADAAAAVCPASGEPRVALTGGLFKLGAPLLDPLEAELAKLLPHARPVPAEGDPLDGAVRIAAALAGDGPGLPYDEGMLYVVAEKRSPQKGTIKFVGQDPPFTPKNTPR
ncbi:MULTISPECIES: N-acetylglucosamine kinase [Streptomyces]|uniref:ATPase BadF/BadG/BcrA/BcrD type domain-containing protein n=2 Tax=Streptomyces scabiei TaxID=1930 RepID=C9YU62_STRSW|nr:MULTISPECIES: BadF/BadG/BcrA/BcrD ATPase family protein [Streptomyces]MBP5865480.1 ATPase [Streptomyces sp. LBUM 1484]MBP5933551.1 ATPase [Streptomyces sp. LBUM 1479]MBP5873821.1 ATPase [Streptomyces sp. LBUM 1477]MBP5881532.1 ATPase [Streptomyces sp. LBUM 1487]MBP5897304.1 ATPase [Streptomyces sp. LBUM 1488]